MLFIFGLSVCLFFHSYSSSISLCGGVLWKRKEGERERLKLWLAGGSCYDAGGHGGEW